MQWNLSLENTGMSLFALKHNIPGRAGGLLFSAIEPVTKDHLFWETSFMANGVVLQNRFYCRHYKNMVLILRCP